MPHDVLMWKRAGCHLCEDLEPALAQVCADEGATFATRDVDSDAEALERYGEAIPVVMVDGVRRGMLRVDPERIRRVLQGAE